MSSLSAAGSLPPDRPDCRDLRADWAEASQPSAAGDAARAEAAEAALARAAQLGASCATFASVATPRSIAARARCRTCRDRRATAWDCACWSTARGLRRNEQGRSRIGPRGGGPGHCVAKASAILRRARSSSPTPTRSSRRGAIDQARSVRGAARNETVLMKLNETAMAVKGVGFINLNPVRRRAKCRIERGLADAQRLVRTCPQFTTAAIAIQETFRRAELIAQAARLQPSRLSVVRDAEKAGHGSSKLTAKPVVPGRFDIVVDPSQLFTRFTNRSDTRRSSIVRSAETGKRGHELCEADRCRQARFGGIVNRSAITQLAVSTTGYDDGGVKSDRWHLVREACSSTGNDARARAAGRPAKSRLPLDDWSSVLPAHAERLSNRPTEVTLDELFSGIKRSFHRRARRVVDRSSALQLRSAAR